MRQIFEVRLNFYLLTFQLVKVSLQAEANNDQLSPAKPEPHLP